MTKTTMKNKEQISAIKNLDDLRMAKRKLKLQMKVAENKHDNSFVNKAVSLVTNLKSDTSFTSSKVESACNDLLNFGLAAFKFFLINLPSAFLSAKLVKKDRYLLGDMPSKIKIFTLSFTSSRSVMESS